MKKMAVFFIAVISFVMGNVVYAETTVTNSRKAVEVSLGSSISGGQLHDNYVRLSVEQ